MEPVPGWKPFVCCLIVDENRRIIVTCTSTPLLKNGIKQYLVYCTVPYHSRASSRTIQAQSGDIRFYSQATSKRTEGSKDTDGGGAVYSYYFYSSYMVIISLAHTVHTVRWVLFVVGTDLDRLLHLCLSPYNTPIQSDKHVLRRRALSLSL